MMFASTTNALYSDFARVFNTNMKTNLTKNTQNMALLYISLYWDVSLFKSDLYSELNCFTVYIALVQIPDINMVIKNAVTRMFQVA